MALKPQTLDVKIQSITNKEVIYELAKDANKTVESWKIPANSTFPLSTIEVGKRYKVKSKVIQAKVKTKVGTKYKERFDWSEATEISPQAKIQSRKTHQTAHEKAMATTQIADDGLFQW